MPRGVVLPAPEPQPLSPADRSSMCSFAAALPHAHLEFAGAGSGRVLAMLTVAERRFLFERGGPGIRVREACDRSSMAEAATVERVLAALRDCLGHRLAGEVVPFGSEARDPGTPPETLDEVPARKGTDGGPLILVVEDQPYSATELEELLGQAGYQPLLVQDGTAALAALASPPGPVLAALVSLHLKRGMTGREVVRRLREQLSGLPVVVVTGHPPSAPEADLRGLGGPTARLIKPVDSDKLLQRLAEVIAPRGGGD